MPSLPDGVSDESIKRLSGKLIVSCQASRGEPLNAPEHIAALALSAINGGAGGLRLEGAGNVAFMRGRTFLPIIGLTKIEGLTDEQRLKEVYITPTFEDAAALARSGADIIAIDATDRPRPTGTPLEELITRIKHELGKPVWADVSTLAEGLWVADAGVDVISTTMSGYTTQTRKSGSTEPDLQLLEQLCKKVTLPVVLEGKVWYPAEVTKAFELGAYAVVVGSAITRPQLITRRFVDAVPKAES